MPERKHREREREAVDRHSNLADSFRVPHVWRTCTVKVLNLCTQEVWHASCPSDSAFASILLRKLIALVMREIPSKACGVHTMVIQICMESLGKESKLPHLKTFVSDH